MKENGEFVRGHTKNGPGDGRAKPRHPDHFVEIPFRELKGDLMIGLFGEQPYDEVHGHNALERPASAALDAIFATAEDMAPGLCLKDS